MTVENVPARVRVRRRSREDWVITGVCGGLGRYAERDPLWFRLLFIVLSCCGGIGFLLYIGLWLAIPLDSPVTNSARQRSGCVLAPDAKSHGAGTGAVTAIGSGAPFAG
jgi:phage shock protein PspC (stress-responsive transcriptional regulator)